MTAVRNTHYPARRVPLTDAMMPSDSEAAAADAAAIQSLNPACRIPARATH